MNCFEMVKNIITPLESLDNRQTIVDTLNLHNKLRALHAVPKLSVKQELNNLAQGHAEYLGQFKYVVTYYIYIYIYI